MQYLNTLSAALAERLKREYALGMLPPLQEAQKAANVAALTALWEVFFLALYVEQHFGLEKEEDLELPQQMLDAHKSKWFGEVGDEARRANTTKLTFANRTSGLFQSVNDSLRLRGWLYYVRHYVNPTNTLFGDLSPAALLSRVQEAAGAVNQWVEDRKAGRGGGPKISHPTLSTLLAFIDNDFAPRYPTRKNPDDRTVASQQRRTA